MNRIRSIAFVWSFGISGILAGQLFDHVTGQQEKLFNGGLFSDFTPGDYISYFAFAAAILFSIVQLVRQWLASRKPQAPKS